MPQTQLLFSWLLGVMLAFTVCLNNTSFGQETETEPQTEQEQGDDSEEMQEQEDKKTLQEKREKNEGQEDLDKAFDLKISAQSTRDFDKVCDLCESAIEKGLNEDSETQAKELWAATLMEHAEELTNRILPPNQDRRWKVYRREALSRLNKAIELNPESFEAHLMVGKLSALDNANQAEGREAIMKAVELAGDDSRKLSEALMLRGAMADDEASRLADFNQAVKIDPANIEAIRARGAQYLRMGETDKAISDFRDWIELEPENFSAHFALVQTLMATEKLEDAVDSLGDAIKANPTDDQKTRAYSLRSRLNLQLENYDEAYDDASEALKINQDDVEALMTRATVQSERSKLEEALSDVNRVLDAQPGLVRAIWMRSIIAGQMNDFDLAIKDIKVLVDDDPRNPMLKQQLAMLYNAADEPEKSVKIYDDLVELAPEDASMFRGRGDAYLSLSEHEKAVADYDEALDIDPEDSGVMNNLAWVLATSPDESVRDGERAVELATKAAELTEFELPHILSTLASGYAEMGDFEKAREWAEKAVNLSEDEEQKKGLNEELERYKLDKPWREDQLKELEEKREKMKESDSDEDDSKSDKDSDSKDKDSDA